MKRKILPPLTTADYFGLLVRKLPPGWIWRMQVQDSGEVYGDGNAVPQTRFGRVLWALADELAYFHGRLRAMFAESIPDTATETLDEWEADLGLPFAGYPAPGSDAERRAIIKAQDLMKGGTQNAHFEDLATTLGATVDVYDDAAKALTIVHSSADLERADCTCFCNAPLITFGSDEAERYAYFAARYRPGGRAIYFTDETP